jgi:DNA-binding response OmpR family regulator
VEVILVQWPDEAERRAQLDDDGVPRLLLVDLGAPPPPPAVNHCLEDWIRVTASDEDLAARVASLAARADRHRPSVPVVDEDGVLRFGESWVALPPVEARLTHALVERFGAVVGRGALARVGWPDHAPRRNALDVHMLRLRRRLISVGLTVRTVRSRGYLLERA